MTGIDDGSQTAEVQDKTVRRSQSGDLRESQRGREAGATAAGGAVSDLSERDARKAWAWANLSISLVGGILSQLIEDVRGQLAGHQDSIEWYQGEMEKAASGKAWHEARLTETRQRLAKLQELQAAVTAVDDGQTEADDDEGDRG